MRRLRRLWTGVRRPLLAPRLGAITNVRSRLPLVALTFDDGPDPATTRELLSILGKHGATATHFLVGQAVEARPDLLAKIVEAGHAVGSHTYSHASLVRLSSRECREEIDRGVAALGQYASELFRPPFGHYDIGVARAVRAAGLQCIWWSGHAEDWVAQDAATLASRLRCALKPGAIVLLHETLYSTVDKVAEDRAPLFEALDVVLGELSSSLRFGTVPELLASGTPVRRLVELRGEDAFVAAQVPGGVQSRLSP